MVVHTSSSLQMKVLVLGHGMRAWNALEIPRCAPMHMDEWNTLVQNQDRKNLTFVDCCSYEEPDILANIENDWSKHISAPSSYDFVIDAVSHLARTSRKSKYYWKSIHYALKDDGEYIGWNDQETRKDKMMFRLKKHAIYTHFTAFNISNGT